MNTLQKLFIASVTVFTLGRVALQADAAITTNNLLVSAVVTTSCRVTQDHDHPFIANSVCTNGADHASQILTTQIAVIQRTDSGVEVDF